MEERTWKDSITELLRMILPEDTNIFGNLYGGRLVEWIDNVASIVAIKHARKKSVTGSIDSLFFLSPVKLGDIVELRGRINFVTRSTMEIEVNVFSEEGITGLRKFTTTAFLTYVAIDDQGKASPVPGLKLETDEDKERFSEGEKRYQVRKLNLQNVKANIPEKV